jgi:hypothetical protein
MTNEVQYTLEWTIKSGKLQTFKDLSKQITQNVLDNEPEMKGYQWYFNDAETKCYTAEWHTSSESLMAHLKNVGDVLPKLLELSDITRFEVFGNPNEEALAAVKGLGGQVYGFSHGFTR